MEGEFAYLFPGSCGVEEMDPSLEHGVEDDEHRDPPSLHLPYGGDDDTAQNYQHLQIVKLCHKQVDSKHTSGKAFTTSSSKTKGLQESLLDVR